MSSVKRGHGETGNHAGQLPGVLQVCTILEGRKERERGWGERAFNTVTFFNHILFLFLFVCFSLLSNNK